ncbi:MAG: hypothetical protein COB38_01435 [Gammaproteobacteria bacterium]|nr:MAG: hypothetical protein COB38_01435 [Gammaproteobacteria bacterium]
MLNRILFIISATLFLISCSKGNKPEIVGFENNKALIGESVGLVLTSSNSNITEIQWSQTQGPSVNFIGADRKVIGFDVPSEGQYTFQVEFKDFQSNDGLIEYSFDATSESPVYVNVRLDHEANSQAKMSLQAYEQMPGNITSISWTQIEGPSAVLNITDQLSLNFTAPTINQDILLKFKVAITDDQGNSASDSVNILLEETNIDNDSFFNAGRFADISLADIHPFVTDSNYFNELNECIYSNTSTELCNLGKLPFIGSLTANPTTADIMARVLVSHDWMGVRFQEYLETVDTSNDIKNLLGATTSIVISYDIRPSFFWSGTGAIYLSASYFWVTPEERDSIDTTQDFRSDFSKDLLFADPWRVTKDNEYAYSTPLIASRDVRDLESSKHNLSRVLYHELAHANDFFPPRAWANANNSDFAWTYSSVNQPDSTGLANSLPLVSQEMYDLGNVMFQGETATQTQQNFTPDDVAEFFFPYEATNTYNYSTLREDYAMLAEEYLMTYRFGVLYDQGITGLAPDYIISTAERGRVGHDRTKSRAEYVVANILPSVNLVEASAQIPQPSTLTSGISWWDALALPTQGKSNESLMINKDSLNKNRPKILLGIDRRHQ